MRVKEDEARRMLVAMGLSHAGSVEKMSTVKLAACLNNLQVVLDESDDLVGDDLVLQKRIFRAIENGEDVLLGPPQSMPSPSLKKEEGEGTSGLDEEEGEDETKEFSDDEDLEDVDMDEDEDVNDPSHEIESEESSPVRRGVDHSTEFADPREGEMVATIVKKGRGRPKGSKNKVREDVRERTKVAEELPPKRGRGRPPRVAANGFQSSSAGAKKSEAGAKLKRGPGRPRNPDSPPKREKLPVNRFGARVGSECDLACKFLSRRPKSEAQIRKEAGINNSIEYFLDKQVRLGRLIWIEEKGYALPPKNQD